MGVAGAFHCRIRQVIAARDHSKYRDAGFSIPVENGKVFLLAGLAGGLLLTVVWFSFLAYEASRLLL
jgi:hypothetical protein